MKTILILIAITIGLTSCNKDESCIEGEGGYVTKTYTIDSFDELSVSSFAEVVISEGPASLIIQGQQNILNELEVTVENGELLIGEDNCFGDMKVLKVLVSIPTLNAISTAGDITIISDDTFESNDFSLNTSGISVVDLKCNVDKLNVNSSGDANISLEGNANTSSIISSGILSFNSFDLITKDTKIEASGVYDFQVNASSTLDVDISGSGNIMYKGSPLVTEKISGDGVVMSFE